MAKKCLDSPLSQGEIRLDSGISTRDSAELSVFLGLYGFFLAVRYSVPLRTLWEKKLYHLTFILLLQVKINMTYYIYENWRAGPRKAVIHHGSCVYCNQGTGTSQGNFDPSNGKWHGGFNTLEEARKFQKMMDVKERRECGRCL